VKTIDFNEIKAERDGEITPKVVLENALANLNAIDKVIVIIRQNDGIVTHGVSSMSGIEGIGLCEMGKAYIMNDMWEEK